MSERSGVAVTPSRSSHEERGLKFKIDYHENTKSCGRSSHEERGLKYR